MRSIHKKTSFAVIIGLALCLNVSADLNDGLRAYYKLDGNAIDETGSCHGTVYGATSTLDQFENPDSAFLFDGLNDFIDFGTTDKFEIGGAGSISVWINPNIKSGTIISKDGVWYNDDLTLGFDTHAVAGGEFTFTFNRIGTKRDIPFLTANIVTGRWTHIVSQWDPNGMRLFVDGTLIAENDETCNLGGKNIPLYIGQMQGRRFFNGDIDEVRVYDRVLTESEIRQLAGFEPTALSEGHHVFDMKISARLLEEKRKSTIVGKEKIRGLLVYNGDTDSGRFIFRDRDELIVLETDFTYAEYINSTKETKKVSITQGVASAQIDIDDLLEAVALGSFRYLENPKGSLLNISLAGAGSVPEDEAYGTLLLRYNQKLSDRMNRAGNPEATLQRNVSKVTGVPLAEVEKAMSPEK